MNCLSQLHGIQKIWSNIVLIYSSFSVQGLGSLNFLRFCLNKNVSCLPGEKKTVIGGKAKIKQEKLFYPWIIWALPLTNIFNIQEDNNIFNIHLIIQEDKPQTKHLNELSWTSMTLF